MRVRFGRVAHAVCSFYFTSLDVYKFTVTPQKLFIKYTLIPEKTNKNFKISFISKTQHFHTQTSINQHSILPYRVAQGKRCT